MREAAMPHYKKFVASIISLGISAISLAVPALAANSGQELVPDIARRVEHRFVGPRLVGPRIMSIAGSLDVAVSSSAVSALAANVKATATDLFLVGDSTFVAATASIGFGSSFAGIGFAQSADSSVVNPVLAPPENFEGLVVVGVSVWDVGIDDASAYVRAVETYRNAGYRVVVVEVPESYGHGSTPQSTPAQSAAFKQLNALVADAVGCELQPWTLRDVETVGDVGEADDYVHPSSAGVDQLLANLSVLAAHGCGVPRHG